MKKILTSILAIIILILSTISSLTAIATDKQINNYKSTFSHESFPPGAVTYLNYFIRKHENGNLYFVIDDYDLYKCIGFSDKSKSFFKDNLLIINCMHDGAGSKESRKNTEVTIKDGVINVSYTRTLNYPIPAVTYNVVDIIELKKSDVNGVDLTKLVVNINTIHNNYDGTQKETDYTKQMQYIDAYNLIEKPSQVNKVKLKSTKTKQLKVTWKNIKDVKYRVKYSLKKNMKKAKTKKNITKNTVTLKKLKSGKKYYVRVRAYQKIGSKTYIGEWSQAVSKKVK